MHYCELLFIYHSYLVGNYIRIFPAKFSIDKTPFFMLYIAGGQMHPRTQTPHTAILSLKAQAKILRACSASMYMKLV